MKRLSEVGVKEDWSIGKSFLEYVKKGVLSNQNPFKHHPSISHLNQVL
jgi:hypothetical protein